MKHFLLVFDRSEGRLCRLEEFESSSKALDARFAAERLHRGEADIEVVVLTADSKADLRRTHARYFQDVRQLANRGLERINDVRRAAGRGACGADGFAS
jgi:hypothetical protein